MREHGTNRRILDILTDETITAVDYACNRGCDCIHHHFCSLFSLCSVISVFINFLVFHFCSSLTFGSGSIMTAFILTTSNTTLNLMFCFLSNGSGCGIHPNTFGDGTELRWLLQVTQLFRLCHTFGLFNVFFFCRIVGVFDNLFHGLMLSICLYLHRLTLTWRLVEIYWGCIHKAPPHTFPRRLSRTRLL